MVEDKLLVAAESTYWSLLSVFLLSLGLAAGQLIQMLTRARGRATWLDRCGAVLGLVLACLLSLSVVRQSEIWLSPSWQTPLAIVIFMLASVVPYVHWCLSRMRTRPHLLSTFFVRGTLAVVCASAAGWSGDRYFALDSALDNVGLLFETPGQMSKSHRFVAVTDAGQLLPLYRWRVEEDEFREYSAHSATRLSGMTTVAIRRADADRRTNCHGWVFTGGRFLMYGFQVGQILQDNGYAVTGAPEADDLVIYRNEDGQIVHTGLVRGVLDDGTVMVESKFGVDGRYLHQPADQPFSQTFAYYRSPRAGHCVTIERTHDSRTANRRPSDKAAGQRGHEPSVRQTIRADETHPVDS